MRLFSEPKSMTMVRTPIRLLHGTATTGSPSGAMIPVVRPDVPQHHFSWFGEMSFHHLDDGVMVHRHLDTQSPRRFRARGQMGRQDARRSPTARSGARSWCHRRCRPWTRSDSPTTATGRPGARKHRWTSASRNLIVVQTRPGHRLGLRIPRHTGHLIPLKRMHLGDYSPTRRRRRPSQLVRRRRRLARSSWSTADPEA
jgi:hypothetical protein